ncbi:DUF438 domain-containing protein [Clostridium botulinum]|uniref:DUF438 domain-containing protein n=1 Tax=Clostridium botulinum (strain Langeland / NCTC 10281 / Type F) TaxID=441772 RepID=A7GB57_CLOBL|nr:DUF438 domain-containing protein [Clostridium botulinum]ABS41850.1 conserved hypothetical protein [Clostridium botulinum F str. Langeland]ADF98480.1 conserved hypothetical protein [Clostridium botulinum F str. 230613]KKM40231.1 histidine kinase [Clostridium botulinum]MBY6793482.1 DUF438 domain-containing protein [Clostridium botulinum]MBY6938952.1 DUF438 domain-containing protein [Clostridium botulinum]
MDNKKIQELKEVLKNLNKVGINDEIRKEALDLVKDIDAIDLSIAEQQLIEEGMEPQDLRHLCDVHMEVLKDELSKVKANTSKGHVVYTLIDEHDRILRFLEDLEKVNSDIQNTKSYNEAKEKIHSLHNLAESILDAENHHQREEKVLFVEMEKREITGPTRIMRMEHDDLRTRKKELKRLSESADKMKFDEFKSKVDETSKYIIFNLRDHIFKENYILYPSSLEAIKGKDIWDDMKERCDEIGYCSFTFEN